MVNGLNVRKVRSVIELWESVISDDTVELFLCSPLDVRIDGHGIQERASGRDSLESKKGKEARSKRFKCGRTVSEAAVWGTSQKMFLPPVSYVIGSPP